MYHLFILTIYLPLIHFCTIIKISTPILFAQLCAEIITSHFQMVLEQCTSVSCYLVDYSPDILLWLKTSLVMWWALTESTNRQMMATVHTWNKQTYTHTNTKTLGIMALATLEVLLNVHDNDRGSSPGQPVTPHLLPHTLHILSDIALLN